MEICRIARGIVTLYVFLKLYAVTFCAPLPLSPAPAYYWSDEGWNASDWTRLSTALRSLRCQPIPRRLRICRGAPGRTHMQLPNHLRHQSPAVVMRATARWDRFVDKGPNSCSATLSPFLCALYAPPCSSPPSQSKNLASPASTSSQASRLPCQRLCRTAKRGCKRSLRASGYTWPFKCSEFPETSSSCNARNTKTLSAQTMCTVCDANSTHEISQRFCASRTVIKARLIRVSRDAQRQGGVQIHVKVFKRHVYKRSRQLHRREVFHVPLEDGVSCRCGPLTTASIGNQSTPSVAMPKRQKILLMANGGSSDGALRVTLLTRWRKSYAQLLRKSACY